MQGQELVSFVITDPCIGTKDAACVTVCPVDCIHPTTEEAEHRESLMLFIDDRCIDCGACEPVCPVNAIYPSEDEVPESQRDLLDANKLWLSDPETARSLVEAHEVMCELCQTLPPDQRRDAHKKGG